MSARLQYFYTWGYRSNRTSGLHPFSLPCFLVVSNSFFARGPLLLKSWVKDGSKTHTHENMSMHDCLVVMKVKRGFSCDDLAAMQNLHPSVRNAADCTRISGVEEGSLHSVSFGILSVKRNCGHENCRIPSSEGRQQSPMMGDMGSGRWGQVVGDER